MNSSLSSLKINSKYLLPIFLLFSLSLSSQSIAPGENRDSLPFIWRGEELKQTIDTWTLTKGVIQDEKALLLADEISFKSDSNVVTARGHIKLTSKELTLYCDRITFDWKTKSGRADLVILEVQPDWVFRSDQVSFQSLRIWEFANVSVSPCNETDPGWKADVSKLRFNLDRYSELWNLRLSLGSIPMPIYLPYLIYPSTLTRTSGFLPPVFGNSQLLGTKFGLNYFQTLGPSADLTISPTLFTKEGILLGLETRWNPTSNHKGKINGAVIKSKTLDKSRYRYLVTESFQNVDGWSLYFASNESSDSLFDYDYDSSGQSDVLNKHSTRLFVEKKYDWGTFQLRSYRNRTYFVDSALGDNFQNQYFPSSFYKVVLPAIQLKTNPTSFFGLFWDSTLEYGSLGYQKSSNEAFGTGNPSGGGTSQSSLDTNWGRADGIVRANGQIGSWQGNRFSLDLLGRWTQYGKSYTTEFINTSTQQQNPINLNNPFLPTGQKLDRVFGSFVIRADLPQLSRTYKPNEQSSTVHLIQPFIVMTKNTLYSDDKFTPRFDDVDNYPGIYQTPVGEESIQVGVSQYFLNSGIDSTADESLRLTFSTKFYFAPILSFEGQRLDKWATWNTSIDYSLDSIWRLALRRMNTYDNSNHETSFSLNYNYGDQSFLNFGFFESKYSRFAVPQSGIQLAGLHRLWSDRLRLEYKINYSLIASPLVPRGVNGGEVALAYVEACRAFTLRFSRVPSTLIGTSSATQNRIDFIINLKGLGDLISYRF